MKRLLIIIMFLGYSLQRVYAQENNNTDLKSEHRVALKNNMFSYLIETCNLSLEYQIKEKHSIQAVVQFYKDRKRHEFLYSAGRSDRNFISGYSIGFEYRFYMERKTESLKGVYLSPYCRYFFRDIEYRLHSDDILQFYSPVYFKREIISCGVTLGIQDFLTKYIGADVFIGVGLRHKWDRDFESEHKPYYEIKNFRDQGLEIRMGANLVLTKL